MPIWRERLRNRPSFPGLSWGISLAGALLLEEEREVRKEI
jgi:hypothetical protein